MSRRYLVGTVLLLHTGGQPVISHSHSHHYLFRIEATSSIRLVSFQE